MKKLLLRCFILVLFAGCFTSSKAQSIVTVCGNGFAGYYGDGIAASLAQMCSPNGIAIDAAENVFFCDGENNCIRKITPAGIISKIAGTDVLGYSGDGGPATNAALGSPNAIAIDVSGNIFFGDSWNFVVRRINTSGIISTVAGNGINGYLGDGAAATLAELGSIGGICLDGSGNLYISDANSGVVRMVNTSGVISTIAGDPYIIGTYNGDNIPATAAVLNSPAGIIMTSAGQLLIADQFNDRIRMVDGTGIIHSIYADSMTTYHIAPNCLFANVSGDVYFSENVYQNTVFKLSTTGVITKIAGNGTAGFSGDGSPATGCELSGPWGICFDTAGNLYVSDNTNNRIRKVNTSGIVNTFAGGATTGFGDGGSAINSEFTGAAWAIRNTAGDMFISDALAARIRKVSTAGIISTYAGTGMVGFSGDGGPASAANIGSPYSMDFDRAGNLLFVDALTDVVRKIDTSGNIRTIAGTPNVSGYTGDGGLATASTLNTPANLKVDRYNRIFICDMANQCIRMIDTSGIITTIAGTGFAGYSGDGGPATNAQMMSPQGIVFDTLGNLYFCDAGSTVVRKVNTSGTISTIAGNGSWGYSGDGGPATDAKLSFPCALAIDSAGFLYISDCSNNCIRKIDGSGNIHTVIGTGVAGFSGDGGPASAAKLNGSYGITLDKNGNMFIGDWNNHRIREVIYNVGLIPVDIQGESLELFPNPAKSDISILIHSAIDQVVSVTITDIAGKCWAIRKVPTNQSTSINFDVPNGIYLFSTQIAEGPVSKKILVIK